MIVGPVRHLVDALMPRDRHTGVCQRLLLRSRSTGLISTRCMRRAWKRRQHRSARSASAIMVPRPGPSSISRSVRRRAHRLPHRRRPQPEQLAEHLADFGRGGEIALAPSGSRVT
jgi:hypothetical protein